MNEPTLGKPSEFASPPDRAWRLWTEAEACKARPLDQLEARDWLEPLEQLEWSEPDPAPPDRISKYRLQKKSAELLPGHRIVYCNRKIVFGRTSVSGYRDGETAWFSGVHKCSSPWVCPPCSAGISERRRRELQTGIDYWIGVGGGVLLLTLTVRHGYADTLQDTLSRFKKAQRSLKSGKAWQRFMERWGIIGTIGALEVTHGQHGWHPHSHELVSTHHPLSTEEREQFMAEIFKMWHARCQHHGLALPNEAHGANVVGASGAANYVAKWGFASEMVRARSKRSQGAGRNPWELLHDAEQGDPRAGALFQEYSEAFHGRRQLRWSKGLRKLLLEEPKLFSDQELAELEPDNREHVVEIDEDTWALVVKCDAQEEVLKRIIEGREAVLYFLDRLREQIPLWDGRILGKRHDWG